MWALAYHYSNILASQALSEVKNVQDNILQVLESHTAKIDMEAKAVPPHPHKLIQLT